jgi:hypothetical protein
LGLTNLQASIILAAMAKTKRGSMEDYAREFARKGGKARAAKYPKSVLSKWAKMGGRPPKKGKGD